MLPAHNKQDAPERAKRSSEKTFDRIWLFFFSKKKIRLSSKEEEILVRWDTVFKLRAQGMFTRSQVVDILIKKFEISRRTAYNDVQYSEQLFCNPDSANKDQKREILSEWLIRGAKKAFDSNNLESYQRLLNTYADVNNLKGQDIESLSDLIKGRKPVTILITSDPEALKKQADELIADIEDAQIVEDEEDED